MKYYFTKGFTVIEILLVLSILGILFAVISPQFSKMRENQILNSTVSDVMSLINKASSQSLASLDSSPYGVHFASSEIVLFKGTVYDINAPTNQVLEITPPAIISDISLGGPTALYFNRLTGAPNIAGSISIGLSNNLNLEKIITIDATGRVSTN